MFNFLRYHKIAALFSLVVIGTGLGIFIKNKGFRYSVDFTGGTELRVRFDHKQDNAAIKEMISREWNGQVYNILESNELIVRVQDTAETVENLDQKIIASINAVSPDNTCSLLQTNSISNSIGQALQSNFIFATLIALFLMLCYIALRFKAAFAIGAVVALMHDALMILAIFLIIDNEISIDVVGAILATLGYSINDTIIIFSKIRKNLKEMHGRAVNEIVNISLNQTLRRTLLTSLSTAIVVGAQFVFGGATIRSLSLTLLLGIIFGTLSSIFIASPVMMLLYKEEK
jgi:preprotein translocase subunit SecF